MKIKAIVLLLLCVIALGSFTVYSPLDLRSSVPGAIMVKGKKLLLNGKGMRRKYSFDIYEAGLYLKNKSSDAIAIINENEEMAVRIEVVSDLVTKKRMEEGLRSNFKDAVGAHDIKIYEARINQVVKVLSEDVQKGSLYDIVYSPETESTKIYKDKNLMASIPGLDFKKIVFSVWLGDDPADLKLKKGMLGL